MGPEAAVGGGLGAIELAQRGAHTRRMTRRLPLLALLLLAACHSPIYTDADEAKETCRDLGHEGEAHARCVAAREHQAACRKFVNSHDYTAAEARRRKCE